jgi:hypothetical protein
MRRYYDERFIDHYLLHQSFYCIASVLFCQGLKEQWCRDGEVIS